MFNHVRHQIATLLLLESLNSEALGRTLKIRDSRKLSESLDSFRRSQIADTGRKRFGWQPKRAL